MVTLQFTLAEINELLESMERRCEALAASANRNGSKAHKEQRRAQLAMAERIYDEIRIAKSDYLVDREEQLRASSR